MNVICQYCGESAQFVDSSRVYRKSYGLKHYCKTCNAWVGVHKGTDKPLGVLANAELRGWKKRAHFYFDRLWKSKIMTRGQAYIWLSEQLNISAAQTHIGMFNVTDCKRVVEVVFKFWRESGHEFVQRLC